MRISEGRGEGEVLRELKLQVPSSKFQARSAGGGLELGTWDFFGAWFLVFDSAISLELGLCDLVLRSLISRLDPIHSRTVRGIGL